MGHCRTIWTWQNYRHKPAHSSFTRPGAWWRWTDVSLKHLAELEWQDSRLERLCDSNYVKNMGYSLEGIVAAFSLWGGPDIDMGWLDGCTGCGGTCNLGGSSVTWTNFALEANKNSPNPKVRAAEGA